MRILVFYILLFFVSCNDTNKKNPVQPFSRKTPFLILNRTGSLGEYTGELLKAEGFNEYDVLNIDKEPWTLATLQGYDWVVLPQITLSGPEMAQLANYIHGGGNLACFLPPPELLQLLKLGEVEGVMKNGYLRIDPASEIGRGLTGTPLKIHGDAMLMHNTGSAVVARFPARVKGEADWPAVIFEDIGTGHALCFLYDLPKNIMLTRQGNPDFAGRETDSIQGLRATDLFTYNWVDTAMNCLNHADEQLRLFTHSVEILSHNSKPLPRFWYFPDSLTSLVTLTNDGEKNGEKDFVQQLRDVSAKGARMSLYALNPDKMRKAFVDSLVSEGFEVAAHPDAVRYANNPTWANMTNAVRDKLEELKTKHNITNVVTNANHWFVWCGTDSTDAPDFTAQAKIESNFGIRLDVNYAHYDNGAKERHFLGATGNRQGNFEGSGLPIRFSDTHGNVINIFQHFNNVYDQQYMERNDTTGFFECFKGLLDRSVNEEVYSYISIKAHNDEYFFSKGPLMKMLDYANAAQVPVWTSADLYQFLKVKDEARFSDFNFKKNTLIFTLHSSLVNPANLTFLVPFHFNGKSITMITGNEIAYTVNKKKIKGIDYAMVSVEAGKQYGFRVSYK